EDNTGVINVIINKNKQDLFNIAKDFMLDEIIGVVGVCSNNFVFANNLFYPDIPFSKELKKSPDEVYALFLSDIHVGSKQFLQDNFERFIKWINQEIGSEQQKHIASKTKYVFIAGDVIDGVGIYPNQEKDLTIKDIYEQYDEFTKYIARIPSNIKVIICPGNHDAVRLAEPQPPIPKDLAKNLYELPNVSLVSNPSLIKIHKTKNFPGINVLLYHGYSFDFYVANVDSIRSNGGYDRADLIMKKMLQQRHLAITHSSTLYTPYSDKDPLVIEEIPDIMLSGHIHKASVSHYRNISLICGSCWQSMTEFQEKLGHTPEPCKVPVMNLQTRKIKILNFN
ncbi:DNA polymerase II small subunit, partial [Candidatus Woesearchaeota archaeon]